MDQLEFKYWEMIQLKEAGIDSDKIKDDFYKMTQENYNCDDLKKLELINEFERKNNIRIIGENWNTGKCDFKVWRYN